MHAIWAAKERCTVPERVQPRCKGDIGLQAGEAHLQSPGLGRRGKGNGLENIPEGKKELSATCQSLCPALSIHPLVHFMRKVLLPGPSRIS